MEEFLLLTFKLIENDTFRANAKNLIAQAEAAAEAESDAEEAAKDAQGA